jgi:aspartate-semialdehyde dehydrogenase
MNRIGVVAPQTLLGEAVLGQLAEAGWPADRVIALADDADAGARVDYGSTRLTVKQITEFDFGGVNHVVIAANGERYGWLIRQVLDDGCHVAALAPLGDDLPASARSPVMAVPDSAALVAQRVLRASASLGQVSRADLVSLEPASARGQEALQRLAQESADVLNARSPEAGRGDAVRAFNALGGTGECLDVAGVRVGVTRVEVPVFFGNGFVCHIGFEDAVDPEELAQALAAEDGIRRWQAERPSSVRDSIDATELEASVLTEGREALQQLWITADNLQLRAAALLNGLRT